MSERQLPAAMDVLIVGAGAAGLTLSLLLLQQGMTPVLVERRPEVSWYPRARNLNFRTLEVFRGLGLAGQVQAVASEHSRLIRKQTLASPGEEVLDPASEILPASLGTTISPDPSLVYCPQGRFEPILLAAARQRGADVRYGTGLVSFTQDDGGVTATLADQSSGFSQTVRAGYLVAADGAHSRVRDQLGIPVRGQGELDEHYLYIYFRAPWGDLVRGHEADAFLIETGHVSGYFFVVDDHRGAFAIMSRPGSGVPPVDDVTPERAVDLVRAGIGRPGMLVEVQELARWRPTQRVADRFWRGRVLLAGDAAHTMPPKMGLGANTAIQSAQNLAWKLAAVVNGLAGDELLATYEAERHPVAWLASERSLTGPGAALLEGNQAAEARSEKEVPAWSLIAGYRYRSAAVLDDTAGPVPEGGIELDERPELTGTPGTRIPHIWLARQGRRLSTLDLLDGSFVLFTGIDGDPWCEAARAVSRGSSMNVATYRIGADLVDVDGSALPALGISPDGVIVIRPDGFVGWRCARLTPAPDRTLGDVLARILRGSRSQHAPAPTD